MGEVVAGHTGSGGGHPSVRRRLRILGRMPRFRVIDAFTDRPFRGNPAAVLVLDGPYDDAWAQRVAAEFNLAETTFARPLDGAPDAEYELRWFTPTVEVDLCGHATLATAHALAEDGRPGPYRFRTRSGVLTVTAGGADAPGTPGVGGGSGVPRLWMDFPANPPTEAKEPDGLLAALGGDPAWVGHSDVGDYLVEYRDEAAVRALAPDFRALAAIPDYRGVIATAAADPGQGHVFVSRFFAPAMGIPEDPVTGSAHTVLGPFWGARLGSTAVTGFQCSARGGTVAVELPSDHPDRVRIGGPAVTVSEGRLLVGDGPGE